MLQEYNTHVRNKQALIGIIAAVVILVGAVGVFLYSQNKNESESNTTVTTEQASDSTSMESNLASIFKSGQTQQCNFSSDEGNGNTTSGIIYMSGNQMRTDITSNIDNKSSSIYVIRDGDENYIWGSEFPNNTGMKMTLSVEEYETNEESKKYFDPSKKIDYSCSGWTIDPSVFTPPTTIKFQNLSSLIQGMMQGASKAPTGTAGSTSECTICNSLTGDAKSACMKQFSC